jgi:hypothetical protein
MSAVGVAGSQFTVTVGATAYTDQVTTGTITTSPTITRTKTMGSVNFSQTDLDSTISIDFLYDGQSGMYETLYTAAAAGTSVGFVIAATGTTAGVWTGSAMHLNSVDMKTDAAGVAMCTVQMQGTVTYV